MGIYGGNILMSHVYKGVIVFILIIFLVYNLYRILSINSVSDTISIIITLFEWSLITLMSKIIPPFLVYFHSLIFFNLNKIIEQLINGFKSVFCYIPKTNLGRAGLRSRKALYQVNRQFSTSSKDTKSELVKPTPPKPVILDLEPSEWKSLNVKYTKSPERTKFSEIKFFVDKLFLSGDIIDRIIYKFASLIFKLKIYDRKIYVILKVKFSDEKYRTLTHGVLFSR